MTALLAAVVAQACPAPCKLLAQNVAGALSCDVDNYDYSWGNHICEGILPLCVLRPQNSADVAAAVTLAREQNVPLSYRSGGHSYTCNGIKEDSIHLDLRSLNSVEVRPSEHFNGTEISFGTGLVMRQLLDALGPGQTIVHGQCPTVGAGGLFLHGGYHTTLTLKYGRGNDTVVSMDVVTANGTLLTLSEGSPHNDLWTAMRQAGSSFAIATRISAKVITDLAPSAPVDGGDFFAVDMPRREMLDLMDGAASDLPGLPNYIHVNGVDFLIASADRDFGKNRAWVETLLKRRLTPREYLRSKMIADLKGPVSAQAGGDSKFGSSGAVPYIFSTQEAFATVSFIMPLQCYVQPRMKALLDALPSARDNSTDLGCYLQVTTTYGAGHAFVDYNCPYDSTFYRERQKRLNDEVLGLCPHGMRRYVNTPSTFLTPRDYYPNYDELAAIKSRWDPAEVFRVYQGVRPVGLPPDSYEFSRPYVRKRSAQDWLGEKGWDVMKAWGLL